MSMEHSFIAQTDVIDRYVRGTMPAAERSEFEEHFLDCQECLEQLELARSWPRCSGASPAWLVQLAAGSRGGDGSFDAFGDSFGCFVSIVE
jgi:hypothetical protein